MELSTKSMNMSFKPCYKWNTFNTRNNSTIEYRDLYDSFKPCSKWNTFNTFFLYSQQIVSESFKPCYKWNTFNTLEKLDGSNKEIIRFKPCYKWNTFNTRKGFKRM